MFLPDSGVFLPPLSTQILKLLKGKVVVGHALHNDFQALKYIHPQNQTRDTTYVPNLLRQPSSLTRARVSLKDLALNLLHKKIQVCGTEPLGREGKGGREGARLTSIAAEVWIALWPAACIQTVLV